MPRTSPKRAGQGVEVTGPRMQIDVPVSTSHAGRSPVASIFAASLVAVECSGGRPGVEQELPEQLCQDLVSLFADAVAVLPLLRGE